MGLGDGSDIDSLNPARYSAAQTAIAKLNDEYLALARVQIDKVRCKFAARDGADADDVVSELHWFAHNQYGQGATFNYPLISEIAGSFRDYLKRCDGLEAMQSAVIEAHFDAMDETFDKALCGEFGNEGEWILARLADLSAPQ